MVLRVTVKKVHVTTTIRQRREILWFRYLLVVAILVWSSQSFIFHLVHLDPSSSSPVHSILSDLLTEFKSGRAKTGIRPSVIHSDTNDLPEVKSRNETSMIPPSRMLPDTIKSPEIKSATGLSAIHVPSSEDSKAVDRLIFEHTRQICDQVDKRSIMTENEGIHSTRLVQECFGALNQSLTDPSTKQMSETFCEKPTLFHAVWVGPLKRTVRLSLMSIVYNHPPGCVDVTLWTVDNPSRDAAEKGLRPYVPEGSLHVRTLDGKALMEEINATFPDIGYLLEEKHGLFDQVSNHRSGGLAAYSDALRFLLLAAYGGVYLDVDVLVMRSFRPLQSRDFWYRWSTQDYCNTAVLHLKKGSPNAKTMLVEALNRSQSISQVSSVLYPSNAYALHNQVQGTIELLPSAYFDPTWAIHDLGSPALSWTSSTYGMAFFPTFFNSPGPDMKVLQDSDEFLFGGFAYHWHNQWDAKFQEDSIAAVFERHFDSMAAKLPSRQNQNTQR